MIATAIAHPNFALVKYWGKRDTALNLPAVPSLSLTIGGYATTTRVEWGVERDDVEIDGARDGSARRVLAFLDRIDPDRPPVAVRSHNNFPAGAGLASSSSAFAALAVAAVAASGRELPPERLSVLARRGSGSACRSVFGGWVEWRLGTGDADSHAVPVAPADHWDVVLVVAVVSGARKAVGSTEAMERARATSPYWDAWVDTAPADVEAARAAVLARDLQRLGEVMERSTFKMHATAHTSSPPLLYEVPATISCLHAVFALRADGVGAWATMDAGPNVKVLCARADAPRVEAALRAHVARVETLFPGGPPVLERG